MEKSDTTTAGSTTQAERSSQLREEWAGFDESVRYWIKASADAYRYGDSFSADNPIRPFTTCDDGTRRPTTLEEVLRSNCHGPGYPEMPVLLAHAQRYIEWRKLQEHPKRLADFVEQIGPRHQSSTLENYVTTTDAQRKALEAVTAYCDEIQEHVAAGRGIVLNGTVGTGKTHLMAGCARRAIAADFIVVYRNGQQFASDLRARIGAKNGQTEAEMIDALVEPKILILDDVVHPHGELTSYVEQILYVVADRRYNAMKPTWVGLNVATAAEAQQRIGAAIVDRWKDGALALALNWPSHRKAGTGGAK